MPSTSGSKGDSQLAVSGETSHISSAQDDARTRWLPALVHSLRPHQWIKNAFVLAPLFFSKSYLDPSKLLYGLIATVLFCMLSGTVYLLNDLFDVHKDRLHPTKKFRPIARGALPIPVARRACAIMGGISLLGAFALSIWFGLVAILYVTMNLAYSSSLKHIAFVDVSIIALGFLLRTIAGAAAIEVYLSEWLLACTFFLALYLGLGKRLHELNLVLAGEITPSRKVLARYRERHLDFAVLLVAGITISIYTIYTLTAALPDQPLRSHHTPFGSVYLPLTIPFAILGIARFYQLIHQRSAYSPTELLLKDRPFIINLLLWTGIMVLLSFSTS